MSNTNHDPNDGNGNWNRNSNNNAASDNSDGNSPEPGDPQPPRNPVIPIDGHPNQSKNSRPSQARINGAKSKGPVTPEGKARSSRNSIKHAYCAKSVILTNENQAAFQAHRDGYIETYRPANYVELDLVETLCVLSWNLKRLHADMAALISHQMALQSQAALKGADIGEDTRSALAHSELLTSGAVLDRMRRYENQISRNCRQFEASLREHRNSRAKDPGPIEPNEIAIEEQSIQQKVDNFTPPTTGLPKIEEPERECESCLTVIQALAPFPQVRDTVLTAILERAKQNNEL